MIFTRDFVTRVNYWQIASLATQKSLFTATHALFFFYEWCFCHIIDDPEYHFFCATPNLCSNLHNGHPLLRVSIIRDKCSWTQASAEMVTICRWYLALFPTTLQWRHNGRDGILNDQLHHCLLSHVFRHRSKKTSKPHVTGLHVGTSLVTGEFPAPMASNMENVSIWWRHVIMMCLAPLVPCVFTGHGHHWCQKLLVVLSFSRNLWVSNITNACWFQVCAQPKRDSITL